MQRKWKLGKMIPTDRDREMHRLVSDGASFNDVAIQYGLSRERVRQIFWTCFGMTMKDCGRYKNSTARIIEKSINKRDESIRRKEERCSKKFGCDIDTLISINGKMHNSADLDYSTPAWKYSIHRRNAKKRNIEWNITFPEWWNVWKESGKYHLRGRGNGYAMARYGDSGAYEVGNVYICTGAQNSSDQYLVYSLPERVRKMQEGRRLWIERNEATAATA